MPSLEQLKELDAALEKATEGSRELDYKILNALFGFAEDTHPSVHWLEARGDPSQSLDAADALRREVVPGWDVYEASWRKDRANFMLIHPSKSFDYAYGNHAVPAIAFCRAIVAAKIKEVDNA